MGEHLGPALIASQTLHWVLAGSASDLPVRLTPSVGSQKLSNFSVGAAFLGVNDRPKWTNSGEDIEIVCVVEADDAQTTLIILYWEDRTWQLQPNPPGVRGAT